MSNRQRAALLLGALVVLVAAFVALRPSEDESSTTADTVTAAPPAAATSIAPAATTQTATTAPKPRPTGPLLTAGEVTEIEVQKGDTVRFRARSQTDDEVHVHGYDISEAAPAGKTISMSFPATLEGIFEVEFEVAGTEIARLTVNP